MTEQEFPTAGGAIKEHINRQIPPFPHTAMYSWHKYWGRKTWNVVAEYIKTYCPKGGIVLDPFAGSGVAVIEALKHGRRAIACDLSPIATEIIKLTIKPVNIDDLVTAFKKVEESVKDKILELYMTKCRKCGKSIPFDCAVWVRNECREIRYASCPYCGDRREKKTKPLPRDKKLLREIEKERIHAWYPDNKLYYPNGNPFMKREKYHSLDELFTRRNLRALAWLMQAIEKEKNKILKDFLKISFTSMLHLCSRLLAEGRPGYRPFSGVGWNQQSYWSVPRHMESNVWEKFRSAVFGHQGIINAKQETNAHFHDIRFAKDFRDVVSGKADIAIFTEPCQVLLSKMEKEFQDGCVDYIFTDPPYASSIQYGELSYLWVAWLSGNGEFLSTLRSSEVVENKKQGKNFDSYESLLRGCMEGMYKVLKPNRYMHMTFHNPTFKVRNTTIRTGVFAGFEFQKVHHQELARPSAKSLLQPFGSVQGDLYLRFFKASAKFSGFEEQTDKDRFEKIIVETAVKVIVERGEETPYAILINAIDRELARNGFFRRLKTGIDVETVLKQHIDKEFALVDTFIGGVKGKTWWLKDPSQFSIDEVPLSERVEQTVLRKLQEKGRVTFTDVWDAVSTAFPNSLTTDSTSIKEALSTYADKGAKDEWRIKQDAMSPNIHRAHSEMIYLIARAGRKLKYDIWIGRPEQGHDIPPMMESGNLGKLVTVNGLEFLADVKNPGTVELIDVLWISDKQVVAAFEVEATTSMTELLNRGSNLSSSVPKYIVTPQSSEGLLIRKLCSPLFGQRYGHDNWKTIYFEVLRRAAQKGAFDPEKIAGKKVRVEKLGKDSRRQKELFSLLS